MPQPPHNPKYLYSLYRNSDDRLMAFDTDIHEIARIAGFANAKSVIWMFATHKNINKKWTITRELVKNVEAEVNE